MSDLVNDLSYDTVIPSGMWMNENLELSAVKLYALIRGLTKTCGYCYARNSYLVQAMKASPSSIKRWLGMLKNEGYIDVETTKDGLDWQRKIYISDKFKKSLRRLTHEPPPAHPRAPPGSPVSHIKKEYSKEEDINNNTPPTPSKEGQSVEYGAYVRLRTGEYDKLVAFIGSKDKADELIDQMNDAIESGQKKQFKAYFPALKNWWRWRLSNAKQIDSSVSGRGFKDGLKGMYHNNPSINREMESMHRNGEREGENRTWWSSFEKITYLHRDSIRSGSVYVEFSVRGNPGEKVYYNDTNFQLLCKHYCKKIGIEL